MKKIISLAGVLFLSGCGGESMKDLENYVAEVKSKSEAQVEPLPEIKPYEVFTYDALALRSPFEPPKPDEMYASLTDKHGLRPDRQRRKEPLEAYSLDALKMVGTLEKANKKWAIITDKDGVVHRVTVGNYIGQNHGKISQVTEEKIVVTEIMPDGQGDWEKREASITLVD